MPKSPPSTTPYAFWRVERPYGYAAATDAVGTTAAPLLAGFAVALIGLVLSSLKDGILRWSDATLALLSLSVIALLGAVECAFWARQYVVKPGDLAEWWPDVDEDDPTGIARWTLVRREQHAHVYLADVWFTRTRRAYQVGILLLLAGVTLALVPRKSADLTGWRWISLLAPAAMFGLELIWLVAGEQGNWAKAMLPHRLRRALAPRLVDGFNAPEARPYGSVYRAPPVVDDPPGGRRKL